MPNENPEYTEEFLEGDPSLEGGEGDSPVPYLRDLTEDDVYDRLSRVNDIHERLPSLESRLNGGVSELSQRLAAFEKGLPTQAAFDADALTKGLEAYDPKLAEVLVPLLQEAFKVSALDENTLRPHLDPIQESMRDYVGQQLVMSAYSPEALEEIIPQVKDGKFMPEGQRQKDFVDWYQRQGYDTQQALLSFGAPYVNALRKFEQWEKERTSSRAAAAATKEGQLQRGQVPAGQHRTVPGQKKLSDEEAFLAGFNEVLQR